MTKSASVIKFVGAAILSVLISSGTAQSMTVDTQKVVKSGPVSKVKLEVEVPRSGAGPTALDILFVVDDSGSMTDHQAKLLANVSELVRASRDSGLNLHAAVITTNMDTQPWNPAPGISWAGQFAGVVKKVAATRDGDFETILADNLKSAMTTMGSGTEQPFAAVQAALSEPLLSGVNTGFLRDGAGLAIFVLTDADDQSQMKVPDFVAFLRNLKSKAPVTMHAAYMPSNDPAAARSGEPLPLRIEETLTAFGTMADSVSLMDPLFASKLKSIGEGYEIAGLRVVQLKIAPVVSTMKLTYGTETFDAGDLSYGWTYNSKKMEVLLGEQIDWLSQPVGTPLVIKYTAK